MDAYAHRVAIGRRFGTRIAAGDAAFLAGAAGISALPYTVTDDGECRQLSGVNRFMLIQVMRDQAWSDSRFFTADQIKRAGWAIAPGAKQIGLQFLVATGDDGLPLEVPEVKRFHVFNASEIAGVPSVEAGIGSSGAAVGSLDVETAAAAAGFMVGAARPGLDSGVGGLPEAVHGWLESLIGMRPESGGLVGAELRIRLATSLLEVQAGAPGLIGTSGLYPEWAAEWVRGIEVDPLSFFAAVKDAEALAAVAMAPIHEIAAKRHAESEIAGNARTQSAETAIDGKASGRKTSGAGRRKPGASARIQAMFLERAAVLAVTYPDKERAIKLGAEYYPPQSLWFVPKGGDVDLFKEWNPRSACLGKVASNDVLMDSFREAMEDLGLDANPPEGIQDDGLWHNVGVNTKKNSNFKKNKSGAYILSMNGGRDGGAIGTIINKDNGAKFTWTYKGELLTPEQKAKSRAEALVREFAAAQELARVQDMAAGHASEIWAAGESADGHGYVVKKGISANGLRQVRGSVLLQYAEFYGESGKSIIRERDHYLIVPMSNSAGELRAVQAISRDGAVKMFMRGGQKKGAMFVLGSESFDALAGMEGLSSVGYVEGIATGASFAVASQVPVVVCFDAGNMETVVAETTGKLRPEVARVLAVDNDQFYMERALGLLSTQLGINPHVAGGEVVHVVSGTAAIRPVALGEVLADGGWHPTAKGKYCLTLTRDAGCEAVRSAVVEIVPEGGRLVKSTFLNRGVEAGRTALAMIVGGNAVAQAAIVMPEFASLQGRPTDWNDLVAAEGVAAVQAVLRTHGLNGEKIHSQSGARDVNRVQMAMVSRANGISR